ncbi:RAD54 [Mytilus edulis]|uniref:RAD54L n=1 Tax=Mytilus edulis TaxID=6550 RepID=A0A8S3V6J1_MYTED|nr:RAD54 [Mytilus edulis]
MTLRYRCFALRLLKMAAAFKKFRSEDILSLYKSAYNTKIPWKEVFEEETENYFSIFEKATNCSRSLVLSSVLSLTSTLCGPNTKVTVGDNSYSTVLNQYIVAVCAPGGGKTNTYYKVIDPVVEKIKEKHGIAIQLEAYTTAGLQKHQLNNQGYGIITCDEGHRFLSSVNVKQSKGEGERSLLCKMWGGKGDSSILVTGTRGFSKTSMSCCLFIQPQPLLSELCQLGGDDGLMDRFLFCVAKPVFNTTAITKANVPLLRDTKLQSFENVMNNIYEEHLAGKHYKLSADAESVFDGLIDSYSDYMNAKYGSDHDSEAVATEISSPPCSPVTLSPRTPIQLKTPTVTNPCTGNRLRFADKQSDIRTIHLEVHAQYHLKKIQIKHHGLVVLRSSTKTKYLLIHGFVQTSLTLVPILYKHSFRELLAFRQLHWHSMKIQRVGLIFGTFQSKKAPCVQIHHTGKSHWVTSLQQTRNTVTVVYVLDSLNSLHAITASLEIQLAAIYGDKKKSFNVKIPLAEVQQQSNGNDMGHAHKDCDGVIIV